jgi:hypothetical protein
MFFLSRSRYGPFIRAAVGVALVIFALAVSSASRIILVLGGVMIVWGRRHRDRAPDERRDSSRRGPGR